MIKQLLFTSRSEGQSFVWAKGAVVVIVLILTDASPVLERVTGTELLVLPTVTEPKSTLPGEKERLPI
nr:hypothetical protein [Candidatus Thiodiazotropha sp. CDECU1]